MKKIVVTFLALICLSFSSVWANKTSVEIKAPAEVKAGTEVTITINVFHNGNSKGHHTDWVYLKINGKEVKRWQFDKNSLPTDGNFVVEFKYTATEEFTIEAEGHCNIHGTAGPKSAVVKLIS
jgi:desulfoferrodoxin (superoxide reductase-like protein)